MDRTAGTSADKGVHGPFGTKIDDADDICTVTVVIPGVRRPGLFGMGRNSDIDIKFAEQSLRVYAEVHVKKNNRPHVDKVLYEVHRLPAKINVADSTYKIKQGQVIIKLHKQESASWANTLDQYGLETDEIVMTATT